MRVLLLILVGSLGTVAVLDRAGATPLSASSPILAPISMPAASHNCGTRQRWVPAGYAKHGKYRAGHCAPK